MPNNVCQSDDEFFDDCKLAPQGNTQDNPGAEESANAVSTTSSNRNQGHDPERKRFGGQITPAREATAKTLDRQQHERGEIRGWH